MAREEKFEEAEVSVLEKIVSVIDLTRLNDSDTEAHILALCQRAMTPIGPVAAVCVFPPFVDLATRALRQTPIKVATVANFPSGNEEITEVVSQIKHSLREGASEIDMVFPYEAYLSGDVQKATDFVRYCKETCGEGVLLKVIIETGVLGSSAVIQSVAAAVIEAGADFIKTSTGKISQGATVEAAMAIITVIQQYQGQRSIGLKISGGVRTLPQANAYLEVVDRMMGSAWRCPAVFRIGASQLLDEILIQPVLTKR